MKAGKLDLWSEAENNFNEESTTNEFTSKESLYKEWIRTMTMEQKAISQLLHAQASYIHAFIGEHQDFPTSPDSYHLHTFQLGVAKVLEAINEKQRLHLKLIDASYYLFQDGD